MRILVISHMYPNILEQNKGRFIHEQTKALKKFKNINPRVISPLPYTNKLLASISPKWKTYHSVPMKNFYEKIEVLYPRYLALPDKPIGKGWFFGLEPYTMALSIKRYLKDDNFSLIHAHTAIPDCLASLLAKPSIPVICHFRGSDIHTYPYYNELAFQAVKKAIKMADQIICVSKWLKKETYKIATPKKEIKVVYNGVDIDKFSPDKKKRMYLRRKYGLNENEKIILFVGALIKEKGIHELIESFKKLIELYQDLKLIIVGKGPETDNLKKSVSKTKEKIIFTGKIPHSEIPEIMNAADIFVLPTYAEGLPNAVLEAMATGLPVIATNVGGIPEVITNGENGLLIRPKSVRDLIESIFFLINHPEISKQMGINARRTIIKRFTWERSAKEILDIYHEVISS